jgi:hypothetical protein
MPAAVFTVLLGALVVPLLPWARTFLVGLDPSGGDGILVGLGFVTVILAGVLLVVSDLMVRLYEGYYCATDSWVDCSLRGTAGSSNG